jgi:hypothetical protein
MLRKLLVLPPLAAASASAASLPLMASAESSEKDAAGRAIERPSFPSFEYVDHEELLEVPVMTPEMETTWEKFVRKFQEDPLVPIGFLVTTGVLTQGLITFKRGNDPAKAQRLMRYRVLAQGFTVAAFAFGAGLTVLADKMESRAARQDQR